MSTAKAPPPPTPPSGLGFQISREYLADPLGFYDHYQRIYGDYILFRTLPGYTWYFVADPVGIEQILQTHQQNYRKPAMFTEPMKLMLGNGLLLNEGQSWVKQRRLAQPAFHRQQLACLASQMLVSIEEQIKQWEELPPDTTINLSGEMVKMAFNLVGQSLFGADLSDKSEEFARALKEALVYVSYRMSHPFALPTWVPTAGKRNFDRQMKVLNGVVDDIIAGRRQAPHNKGTQTSLAADNAICNPNTTSSNTIHSPADVANTDSTICNPNTASNQATHFQSARAKRSDLLDMLMSATDETSGVGMNARQLRDEVITLLNAGHDTVGAALTWTWYLLAQNPRCYATLMDELKCVLSGRDPQFEDLPKLNYTKMVFEEAMRLYPPAWGIPREAIEDDIVGGYKIEKGKIIEIATYTAHRHPEYWHKPEEFIPERFEPNEVAKRPKYAYFPFGGGQRICIGNNFAMMEAQLAIAKIAQRLRFEILPGQDVVPDLTFALHPRGGIKARVHKIGQQISYV